MTDLKVESGKYYRTKDGNVIKVYRNNHSKYKFSAAELNGVPSDCWGELWTEDGKAWHGDAGYDFVEEVVTNKTHFGNVVTYSNEADNVLTLPVINKFSKYLQ